MLGKRLRNPARCEDILAASEAVRKQGAGAHLACGKAACGAVQPSTGKDQAPQ